MNTYAVCTRMNNITEAILMSKLNVQLFYKR